jgi:hypothetical protein
MFVLHPADQLTTSQLLYTLHGTGADHECTNMAVFQQYIQLHYIHYYFPSEVTHPLPWRTVCHAPEDVLLPLLRLNVPQEMWPGLSSTPPDGCGSTGSTKITGSTGSTPLLPDWRWSSRPLPQLHSLRSTAPLVRPQLSDHLSQGLRYHLIGDGPEHKNTRCVCMAYLASRQCPACCLFGSQTRSAVSTRRVLAGIHHAHIHPEVVAPLELWL